jgi:hypothetical protein
MWLGFGRDFTINSGEWDRTWEDSPTAIIKSCGAASTAGFNVQLVCLLSGNTHDTTAFDETEVSGIVQKSGGGIGDKGYQGSDLATPRKNRKAERSARETKKATPQ